MNAICQNRYAFPNYHTSINSYSANMYSPSIDIKMSRIWSEHTIFCLASTNFLHLCFEIYDCSEVIMLFQPGWFYVKITSLTHFVLLLF